MEHPVCVGSGVVLANTGIAEVTRLLNETHAENSHHRSFRSQSTPHFLSDNSCAQLMLFVYCIRCEINLILSYLYGDPASIATLAQRPHWSASSRSAADVAPTLVFRRLRCYGMSAFCRSATVGISWFADVLCLDIGGWKSSVSRMNVVVQPDYRYINYIFRHHDQKNYYASNVNKMYHFAASILFYDIAQLRFPPKTIWVQQVVSTVFPGAWLRKIRQCFFVFRQLSRRFFWSAVSVCMWMEYAL